MPHVRWERYPRVAALGAARNWLSIQANLGLAPSTIDAYARAVEEFITFGIGCDVDMVSATREHVAAYVRSLADRPRVQRANAVPDCRSGLANATLQQRITAVRLFFDHLMEEGLRPNNPVGRGRYTPGKCFAGARERGLIPRFTKLPWIPNDEQWRGILEAARTDSFRNRVMLALAYDSALRREELCGLETSDIDPSRRMLSVRAETTKTHRARAVPYSAATGELLAMYLTRRKELTRERGRLFVSESRRNRGKPISKWSWTKAVEAMAECAGVPEFTTHTTRHLCLTDLARANWDVHEIAAFAGHRSIQTTLLYIHLSGRELAAKLANGMAEIHAWQVEMLKAVLSE